MLELLGVTMFAALFVGAAREERLRMADRVAVAGQKRQQRDHGDQT
jgi:hypothetical protein